MAKQLNVSLAFSADTRAIENNLKSLKNSLAEISTMKGPFGTELTKDLQEAVQSADDLQMHLSKAFNTKTGNLDLNALNASLKSSNQSLSGLSESLLKAGVTGENAFLGIQRAIASANVQINKSQSLLSEFATTLKNTARWQLSSTMLHGFMSTMQGAINYAEDLNASLSDIRIVTGASVEEMAQFAEEANKAARALNTTTNQYAKASLIFYQQGLSTEDVKARTDITVKMANVSGDTAEKVSDQLTAIWNNFYDGSKSLEYYADVMTALGAATASSTDEIAGGLEKFAAIGETIGLSYEYAASALATITSNTRQSEEVVGTALKTIFARIQGLNLGETLDDGVTLNKYSEALAKVGISIFDATGELKNMDDILDEIGAKWDTINKSQQVALAQTVAGVRQYNQLVALMDNWDNGDSDSMQANLNTAYMAEGTLQSQADIYAETWEAASAKVRAAMEKIYNELIPTDLIIKITNFTGDLLNVIGDVIKGFGGFKSVLLLLTTIIVSKMKPEISAALDKVALKFDSIQEKIKTAGGVMNMFKTSFKDSLTSSVKEGEKLKQVLSEITAEGSGVKISSQNKIFNEHLSSKASDQEKAQAALTSEIDDNGNYTANFKSQQATLAQINNLQTLIHQNAKLISAEEREKLEQYEQELIMQSESLGLARDKIEALRLQGEILKDSATETMFADSFISVDNDTGATSLPLEEANAYSQAMDEVARSLAKAHGVDLPAITEETAITAEQAKNASSAFQKIGEDIVVATGSEADFVTMQQASLGLYQNVEELNASILSILNAQGVAPEKQKAKILELLSTDEARVKYGEDIVNKYLAQAKALGENGENARALKTEMAKTAGSVKKTAQAFGNSQAHLKQAAKNGQALAEATVDAQKEATAYDKSLKKIKQTLEAIADKPLKNSFKLSETLSDVMSLTMALTSIKNAFDTIADTDASFLEKMSAGVTAIISSYKSLSSVISIYNGLLNLAILNQNRHHLSMLTSASTMQLLTTETDKEVIAKQLKISTTTAEVLMAKASALATLEQARAEGTLTEAMIAETLTSKLGIATDAAEVIAKKMNAGASFAEAAAEAGVTVAKGGAIGASIAHTTALIAEQLAAWGLNAALAPLVAVILLVVAAIAGVIAVGALLVFAFKAIKNSTPEAKMKAAEEQAKKTAEAFQSVKSAVEETNEALNSIEDQYAAIEKLTEGTTEWYEAVAKVNAEVLALIEKYPQLQQYLYQDDGILKISQQGLDELQAEQNQRLQAANNLAISDKIRSETLKRDYAIDDLYTSAYSFGSETGNILANTYNNPMIGDQMFSREMSNSLFDTLLEAEAQSGNMGKALYLYGHSAESVKNNAELYASMQEKFYDDLIESQETIVNAANTDAYLQQLEDMQMAGVLNTIGSKRSASDANALIGSDYSDIRDETKGTVKKSFGDWNDHINYKETDKEWADIEKFMSMQGDDVKYVAQRWGKMVLEVDGKEIEYSKDEVYNALAELYTSDEIKTKLSAALTETLGESLQGIDLSTFNTDQIIQLDNLMLDFEAALSGTQMDGQASNIMNQIIAEQGGSAENLASFLTTIQGIDLTNNVENLRNFNAAAQQLAEGTITVEQFTTAMEKMNAAAQLENMDTYFANMAEMYGMDSGDADAMKDYAKHIMDIAESSSEFSDELATNADSAAELSVEITRMNKGVKKLANGFEDWNDILTNSSKESQEYAEAMSGIKDALSDILDVNKDLLSSDFVTDNLPLIEKAATGSAEAIDELTSKLDEEIILNITAGQTEQFVQEVTQAGQIVQDLAMNLPDIEVGAILQDEGFLEAANALVEAAGMTADEANAYFAGIGYEPVYNAEDIPTETTIPNGVTKMSVQNIGWNKAEMDVLGLKLPIAMPNITYKTESVGLDPTAADGAMRLVSFSGDGKPPQIKGFRKKASGSSNNYSGSNAGGGSPGGNTGGGGGNKNSAPSKAEKRSTTNKNEVMERYREIEDSIDNVTDALSRAEKATDRLWGKDKLKAMKQENTLLQQQYNLLNQKAEAAKKYAEEDAKHLREVAEELGVSVEINAETGDITNIESTLETLYKRLEATENEYNRKVEEYNAAIAEAGKEPTDEQIKQLEIMKEALEAYEKDYVEAAEKDIETFKDAESQYQESIETWEDMGLEMEDVLDQIMQNNYDIIMEGLEIPLSLNEEDLRLVELRLSQIEDDMYSMAEAVALTSGQLQEYQDNLRLADEAMAELTRAHNEGEITDAAYQEGLSEIRDTYYDNVESLIELDATMKEYYGNTISMANDELSKYTSQLEHQTSVLEHYNSLVNLMGKSTDYAMIGKILEGQVETTKNSAEVSRQWYESRRADADALAAEYQAAVANGASAEELEMLKQKWQDAEVAANEAQEQMLSDAEAWAEALKAVLENKLSELGQTLENALTGEWGSFDAMTTAMERANSLQEEYLTTTNQIYETNKLMRTAQQEIDKSTNSVAKRKLQAYIEETKELQNQTKLSQYELDIQQAKYDLLMAEIALEEAQQSKSTVRLQRDSEGNFGYVYTADSNQMAEAQQNLEDAQNRLYNIGLDGANDYAQKYQQTMSEMYDTMAQIQEDYLNGAFESEEEYNAAMENAKAYYYEKLQDYSKLYSVALTTDSRVVADAWSTDFSDMIYDTEKWMGKVDEYVAGTKAAFISWQTAVSGEGGVTSIIGGSLEEVGSKVTDVTDKSEDLAEVTTQEVIPGLEAELTAVDNLTGAYARMRDTISDTIEQYENLINGINNSQTAEWNSGDSGDTTNNNNNTDSNNDSGGNTDNNNNNNNTDSNNDNTDNTTDETTDTTGSGDRPTWSRIMSAVDRIESTEWGYGVDNRILGGSKEGYTEAEVRAAQQYINYTYPPDQKGQGKSAAEAKQLMGYDTGGYTGDWAGSYGKLALLHKKELVLKEGDTANFLEGMSILDKIVSAIDLYSMNSQLGGMLFSPSLGRVNDNKLEQQVHIEASFPAVQDRNEIEEAFNNLINRASQYANRK